MKRKILSILLALVLVLSFSLVTAVPVAAVDGVDRYVDDSVTDSGDGTSSATAFKTIGEGITAAGTGDTINVAEGTYPEKLTINKDGLTLQGDGSYPVIQPALNSTSKYDTVITVSADNVTIKGLDISNALGVVGVDTGGEVGGSHIEHTGIGNFLSPFYINLTVDDCRFHDIVHGVRGYGDGLTVTNCDFTRLGRTGVYGGVECPECLPDTGSPKSLTVKFNTFHDFTPTWKENHAIHVMWRDWVGEVSHNNISGMRMGIAYYYGGPRTGPLVFCNNTITDLVPLGKQNGEHPTTTFGVALWGSDFVSGENTIFRENTIDGASSAFMAYAASPRVVNNNIVNNDHGIDYTGAALDATNNWWGTTDGSAIQAMVSGNVDYSPWWGESYLTGTAPDIELDDHPWTWYTNDSIQDAIGIATAGDTVNVAAGTYAESVTINKDNLTITGDVSQPAITGGLKFDTDLTGLTLENFYVTGTADPDPKNSVVRMYGAITDLTIDNCVFDGENVADRNGFSGGQLEGDVSITASEFKNILGWSLLDSRSGSGGDGSAMGTVIFASNNVHDSNGTVVFRGLSTDWTDNVYIYGNTFENIGETGVSDHWAAFEVNRADNVEIHDNQIRNVAQNSWDEGQAIQLWKVGTVDIHGNTIENNYQGIAFLKWPVAETYDISNISIYHNSFSGNDQYALSVEDGLTGGPLDAENNWWGHATGGDHTSNPHSIGQGGDVVSDNVDFTPWYATATTKPGTENVSVDHPTPAGTIIAYSDTIQGGIDAALDGDTIIVVAGTYNEQVVIDKALTLEGAGDTTIIQPPGPGLMTTTSIPWIGSTTKTMAAIVSVETTGDDVTIKDLKIDGSLITSKTTLWVAGLVYLETSGKVEGVAVIGNPTLPDRTAGIFAAAITESASLEITGCTVIGYNRAGIYALGGEFTADYHHNEINGPGSISTGVPNGMFFLEGAKGSATYNTVTDLGYTGEGEYRSTGIGTYNAGTDVTFSYNTISNVQNAFALSTGTIGTIVEYNDIYNCHTGVRIEADAASSIIQYNDIHDNDFAIRCGATMGDGNEAHYNNFVDNPGVLWVNVGEAVPNTYVGAVCNVHETYTFDAKYNWWGKIGGPGGKGLGNGDKVSTYVSYDPWLTEDYDTVITDGIAYFGSTISLEPGWNTLSVPLKLKDNTDSAKSANTMAEIMDLGDFITNENVQIVYQYNSGSGWEDIGASDTKLVPLRGYYIKILGTDIVDFPVLYSGQLGLPTLKLSAGWNLIGSAFGIDKTDYGIAATTDDVDGQKEVATALYSIKDKCSVVVSPSTQGQVAAWGTTVIDETKDMIVGEAYWVFMTTPTPTLAGFEFTPIYYLP